MITLCNVLWLWCCLGKVIAKLWTSGPSSQFRYAEIHRSQCLPWELLCCCFFCVLYSSGNNRKSLFRCIAPRKSRTNCYLSPKLWRFGKLKGICLAGFVEILKGLCSQSAHKEKHCLQYKPGCCNTKQITQEVQRSHLLPEDNLKIDDGVLHEQEAT